MPSLSVVQTVPSRRRNDAPALSSPPKPSEPSNRPSTNHLNPTGTSYSVRPSLRAHAIDHRAAHHGLAHAGARAPLRPMGEQVMDGDGEIVIGRQQSRAPGDDPVPVVVGVARDRDVEAILQTDQPLHRVGRRRIHPDAPVPIHRHEPERRIDGLADDREVQAVALGDRAPSSGPRRRRADRRPDGSLAPRIASMSITLPRSLT